QRAKELDLEVFYVFLAPPSFQDLVTRLNMRGTENEQQRARRLETAKVELASEGQFDQVIVNDNVDKAAQALWKVIAREYGL
ncbi:MAG: guanylate kinase, partial [Bifidobacterium sp.]|nr:guanylate kinase [Bifidobacterium sp.]